MLCYVFIFLFYTYSKLQGSQTALQPFFSVPLFYTYSKLQGSQTSFFLTSNVFVFYTYSKLQGSQTYAALQIRQSKFYTYSKLQGSQTSNCHHRTYILGCIVVSKYYFTIKHLSLSIIKILLSPKSFLSSDSINNIETFL